MDYTQEKIKEIDRPTEHFLCKFEDNIYGLEFTEFRLRDLTQNITLFETAVEEGFDISMVPDKDMLRTIRQYFGPKFLELKEVGAHVKFKVGEKAIPKLKLVEKHWQKDQLMRQYEVDFPFVLPNSVNEWEQMYDLPEIPKDMKIEMRGNPWQTMSDSFWLAEGKLFMHTKCQYSFHAKHDMLLNSDKLEVTVTE